MKKSLFPTIILFCSLIIVQCNNDVNKDSSTKSDSNNCTSKLPDLDSISYIFEGMRIICPKYNSDEFIQSEIAKFFYIPSRNTLVGNTWDSKIMDFGGSILVYDLRLIEETEEYRLYKNLYRGYNASPDVDGSNNKIKIKWFKRKKRVEFINDPTEGCTKIYGDNY